MATDTATHRPGLRTDGFRRLDHLETGVCADPKRVPGAHRVRVHVPRSTVRSTYNLVRSWAIVGLSSGSTGAIFAILSIKGR